MNITYDYIIIGAGLAGLYCAYQLHSQGKNVIVLEKGGRLGGRIKTINIKLPNQNHDYIYEAGAQRFSTDHKRVFKLIKKLGLDNKLYPLNNQIDYILSTNYKNKNHVDLINQLQSKTKNRTIEYKQSNTFQAIGEDLMGVQFVRNVIDCMGYDAGATHKNFFDFQNYYKDVTNLKYYSLVGGLSSICDRLSVGLDIRYMTFIKDYKYCGDHFKIITNDGTLHAKKLILAIPKSSLLAIPELRKNIESQLQTVNENSYMRIYGIYPPNPDGKYWFENLNKTITDTHIRQIIPDQSQYTGNKGLIQVCYCDSNHADIWFNYASAGLLQSLIHSNLKKLFPKVSIPDPLHFTSHYTPEGTHYWTPNNPSEKNYHSMLKPLDYPLYICGETYSHYQGWLEGALETAEDVLNISQN